MTHVPNELHDAFPEQADALQALKARDGHFQRLAERYRLVNRDIHRIESDVTPASDAVLEDLKKQRLALLDEVATMLARATPA